MQKPEKTLNNTHTTHLTTLEMDDRRMSSFIPIVFLQLFFNNYNKKIVAVNPLQFDDFH